MLIILFILGLAIGSFINVAVYRLRPNSQNTSLRGRSACPKCNKTLTWSELIPVLSFLILKAKCRSCGQPISWQYPLVELLTGFLFVLVYGVVNAGGLLAVSWLVMTALLVFILVYDLRYYFILDGVMYVALALALLIVVLSDFNSGFMVDTLSILKNVGLGGVVGGGFFAILVYGSKEKWMGKGDIKLGLLLGLLAGWPQMLTTLLTAFWLGAIGGVILILLKKKKLSSRVPFAPFLIAGAFANLFLGGWFLNYLGFA